MKPDFAPLAADIFAALDRLTAGTGRRVVGFNVERGDDGAPRHTVRYAARSPAHVAPVADDEPVHSPGAFDWSERDGGSRASACSGATLSFSTETPASEDLAGYEALTYTVVGEADTPKCDGSARAAVHHCTPPLPLPSPDEILAALEANKDEVERAVRRLTGSAKRPDEDLRIDFRIADTVGGPTPDVSVLLDGVLVEQVREADEIDGTVFAYVPTSPWPVTLRGCVEVRGLTDAERRTLRARYPERYA